MANTITGFLERLTAAAGDYNKAKVARLGLLGSVYLDVRPAVARQGQTIRIYFPDVAAMTDQANNDWTPEDLNPGYVDMAWGQRPGKAILVLDFEQFQTATDILDQFIDPCYKRACEYANGAIAALLTAGNFNAYPALQSATPASIPIGTAANAWDVLTGAKVPVQDPASCSLVVHNNVHRNMLTDSNWYQENLVGAVIANQTRQNAADGPGTPPAFNYTRKVDQQMPTSTTANLTGTIAVTNGSTAVTGTGTAFTTQAPVGSWIKVATDTAYYRVEAVTSDTALVLSQGYAGTTGSGKTYQRVTYTSVAMNKYAIALAVRPLELVNNGSVQSRLVMIQGLPFRLMLSYQHLKAGWLMTLDYAMVAAVIRPDFGILIQS